MGYSFQRTKTKIDKAKVKMNMSKTFILSTDLVEFLCILGCMCKFPLKLVSSADHTAAYGFQLSGAQDEVRYVVGELWKGLSFYT